MASLNKESIRSEVSRIKQEFEALCSRNLVSGEVKILMSSMLMVIDLILAVFLEKLTSKTSANSSIPPSKSDKDNSALSKDSQGKGPPEKPPAHTRTRETVQISHVSFCDVCGEDLTQEPCVAHQRRTTIDIVFEKVVTHVDAQLKQCPCCNKQVMGTFPENMPGPLQYGLGLKAFAINLMLGQMVAIQRVQKLINALIGEMLSAATLLKFVWRLHQALEGWEQQAKAQLLKSSVLHVDETSLRVDKRNYWIHVYSSGSITLKFLHSKRGKEAIEKIAIIPDYGGTIIHDCWASYLSYGHCGHGLCGAHLVRELRFIIDAHDYPWARAMKRLLQETCATVSDRAEKCLNEREYANLQKRYRNILTRGAKQMPPIEPRTPGQRGKLAKSDAHNLWERLKKHEKAVLLFAAKAQVPFTNNRAERDLRMAKVKQKVSGCFRTEQYAEAYCRISSYLQSMASKGHNPLVAIQMALSGDIQP